MDIHKENGHLDNQSWKNIAEAGRSGLEKIAENELRQIAKEEGIDESLDAGEVIDLILEAANKKGASKEEKKDFIKKAGISASLTMLEKCPKTGKVGIAASIGGTVVAVVAVVIWYFV